MTVTGVSEPITVTLRVPPGPFRRADLEFHGVDHARSSFTARIFLNNPAADASTPTDAEHGFAGRFHVFGHGGCAGDEGHCEVPAERRPHDLRPPHQLAPLSKRVVVTDALRRAAEGGDEVRVTVVAVLREELVEAYGPDLTSDLLTIDRVDLLTYR